jgi:anti-anti-sigma regulatory factor
MAENVSHILSPPPTALDGIMHELSAGWSLDVERGPGWVFVTLHGPTHGDAEGVDIAEQIWSMLESSMTYRVVIEMQQISLMRSYLIGQLVMLHKRVATHEGTMRLAGMSNDNQTALAASRLDSRFPQFGSREEAVHGYRPMQPR